MKKYELDNEEQELLDLFEAGKLKRPANAEFELEIAKQAAVNYFKKDARINIRLSSVDLQRIKRISANEGLPYQTLIASVLHKFANKTLVPIES